MNTHKFALEFTPMSIKKKREKIQNNYYFCIFCVLFETYLLTKTKIKNAGELQDSKNYK